MHLRMLSLLHMCHKHKVEDSKSIPVRAYNGHRGSTVITTCIAEQDMQWLHILPDMYSRSNEKLCHLSSALLRLLS